MPALKFLVLTLAAASGALGAHPSSSAYSTRMIDSVISRQQGIVSSGAATSTLESGILALAIQSWLDLYPAQPRAAAFASYVENITTSVSATFSNASSTALLPLDRLTVGQALLGIPDEPGHNKLSAAEHGTLDTLNASLALQQRNQYGGFWYYVYPYWSYLDGAVSFLPFMAAEPASWSKADMLLQLRLLYDNCFQNTTGLVVHGYDASKTAPWVTNNATGASPYVWGRSLGWYLAGLVNTWEILADPEGDDAELLAAIRSQATTLTANLVRYADPATGAWYQLPTFPGRAGNFLESSSTALFVFAMLKGLRLGLLRDDGLRDVALRAYGYAAKEFVIDYHNGTLGWNGTVAVCSLNSTASYEYYTGRPITLNAPLGEGAFVWASLEVERLGL